MTTVSPAAPAAISYTLSDEQAVALTSLETWLADPLSNWSFVLKGFAGTGKTFLMQELLKRSKGTYTQFAFTAPTNKAAKVLRHLTGDACTIFSLLGLRIEKNGELKELAQGKSPHDLDALDIVVIDEGGMVSSRLYALLQSEADRHDFRVIFMGDEAQLPPVGEATSPIWTKPADASLTQVMRHDNQILTLVTNIRDMMKHPAPSITIKNDNDGEEGVWKLSRQAFKEMIYNQALEGAFADGESTKVVAWRNVRVGEYNDLIRRAIFGGIAHPGNFLVGDRIIAGAPCYQGEQTLLLATDEEAVVQSVIEAPHPTRPEYQSYELKCVTEDNRVIRLLTLHPSSAAQFQNDLQALAHRAKLERKLWKQFWQLQETFHEIRYAYAITAHRAQGSTYDTVYVDYGDILQNRNRMEGFQCLYVACSRPRKRLILA